MPVRYAVKRLAAVEIEANRSHQHEFNATELRKLLGVAARELSGKLDLMFYGYGRRAAQIVADESKFTLYNSREGKPRSAEYRLYYDTEVIQQYASVGDLFVAFHDSRAPKRIRAIIARRGSAAEASLLRALDLDPRGVYRRFVRADASPLKKKDAAVLGMPSFLRVPPHIAADSTFRDAVHAGKMPGTRELALGAQRILATEARRSADDFLNRALELETQLFSAIESELGQRRLDALLATGDVQLAKVLSFAMSLHQARRSRRGSSLQHHFAELLRREGIPFTAQCETEGGEKPDFVVPGKSQYDDPGFPESKLRLIACKSTVRERWGQILKEAKRIAEKYVLTLDPGLNRGLVAKMHAAGLRAFLPEPVLRAYATSIGAQNVAKLVEELKTAIAA